MAILQLQLDESTAELRRERALSTAKDEIILLQVVC